MSTEAKERTAEARKGSQENPWTLQEVVHALSDHADLLGVGARLLQASEPPNTDVLRLVLARAEKAASTLWAIEGESMTTNLRECWRGAGTHLSDGPPENRLLYRTLDFLPLVVVALDHAIQYPDNPTFALDFTDEPHLRPLAPAYRWADFGLQHARDDLRAWLEAVTEE